MPASTSHTCSCNPKNLLAQSSEQDGFEAPLGLPSSQRAPSWPITLVLLQTQTFWVLAFGSVRHTNLGFGNIPSGECPYCMILWVLLMGSVFPTACLMLAFPPGGKCGSLIQSDQFNSKYIYCACHSLHQVLCLGRMKHDIFIMRIVWKVPITESKTWEIFSRC